MSVGGAPVETWPVARTQALQGASPITVFGDAWKYGFAIFTQNEWAIEFFDDRLSRDTELTCIFTNHEKWGYPLSWEGVFVFEPDKPIQLVVVVEADGEEDDQ